MTKHHINYFLLGLAVVLTAFGIVFLSTLSAPKSLQFFGNTNYYLFRQLLAVGIGTVFLIIGSKIPLSFLKRVSIYLFGINIILLALVFLPVIGGKFWGASRWIGIGGIVFQPSEFLKITAVLYVASWLSNRLANRHTKNWKAIAKTGYENFIRIYLPFLCFLGIIGFMLFLQKDLSTLAVISASLLAMYFAAETPFWHTILTVGGGISTAVVFILAEPWRLERFKVLFRPDVDPLGKGLQLKQSLIAVGSGGWFGKGLGMSTQKFGFLPQAMGDSIFAIIGEELGIIGCIILVILFVLLFKEIIKISNNSTDRFSKLVAVGFAFWIIIQTFMSIASAIGIFPLAGIPLPFFSQGGSHIMVELAAIGLLLNISKNGSNSRV